MVNVGRCVHALGRCYADDAYLWTLFEVDGRLERRVEPRHFVEAGPLRLAPGEGRLPVLVRNPQGKLVRADRRVADFERGLYTISRRLDPADALARAKEIEDACEGRDGFSSSPERGELLAALKERAAQLIQRAARGAASRGRDHKERPGTRHDERGPQVANAPSVRRVLPHEHNLQQFALPTHPNVPSDETPRGRINGAAPGGASNMEESSW